MSGMRFLLKDDAFMGKIVYSNQLLDLRREDKYIHCQEWRLTYDFCNTFPPADSEMNTAWGRLPKGIITRPDIHFQDFWAVDQALLFSDVTWHWVLHRKESI